MDQLAICGEVQKKIQTKSKHMSLFIKKLTLLVIVTFLFTSCNNKKEKMEQDLRDFIALHEAAVVDLSAESARAYYSAALSGKEEDYQKYATLSLQESKIYANKESFEKIKKIKDSGLVSDTVLKRQMDVLYNLYQGNQMDEKVLEALIQLSTSIENRFSTFRVVLDGKEVGDNDVDELLRTSKDSKVLEQAWTESKKIGPLVAEDVIKLVKMRNEAARSMGYDNYHQMSLKLSDQDPEEVARLFDELDSLTRGTYAGLKSEIDSFLSARLGVPVGELMPWHYQNRFFQEAPAIYNVNLDAYYAGKDLNELTRLYYEGLGLPVDEILANSDMFEKPGKNQHAFCINIDRKKDVRVLCNVRPNAYWMNTNLHEFGHAVYDRYLGEGLPFSLKTPAHIFTTEAIAMIFGRMASNPYWMEQMGLISAEERDRIYQESFNMLRLEQLVFSRWSQVMFRFENAMYENPDQDLNNLWWDIVEKYQMVKKPENRNMPDWATKIHIATSPCYYHNYLMGELLASQLQHYMSTEIMKTDQVNQQCFVNQKAVGSFLLEKVFRPGALYQWNEMIEKATGEKLTAKHYAAQFVY